jgi:2-methylfumaryl-CoA hydratase
MVEATGCGAFFDAFSPGDRIDHEGGITIDESDHTLATKLYQNNAIGHFDALAAKRDAFGRRIVYGGHVISLCRALSYVGLENVVAIAAINAGTHVSPTFAGDTVYAASEVVEKYELPGRSDVGAIRLRLWGLKNRPPAGVIYSAEAEGRKRYDPAVVLDLDYTVVLPR